MLRKAGRCRENINNSNEKEISEEESSKNTERQNTEWREQL